MREGLLVICIVVVGVIFSCRKNPPDSVLPPITKTGEHTLGFFLNNQTWVPYDRGNHEVFELPKPQLEEDGSFKISATRIDEDESCRNWFCIEISNFDGIGEYQLSSNECTSPYQSFYYGYHGNRAAKYYEIDDSKPHIMEVTFFDPKHKIIAGNFEFDAISNIKDTIRIRSGRFDLVYE
ncbi:MAG: hypothetical protein HUJ25_02375 [Crocinitomicaceae bacterium]|nr:hypothetical protein [Crocinitomicaceae bacterium]